MKRAVVLLALALGCTTICGCSGESSSHSEPTPELAESPGRQWLRPAWRLLRSADRAQSVQAQLQVAASLATLAGTAPPPEVRREDAVPVRQDLYGRAADLYAKLGEPRRALELLTEGLALGDTPSPFRTQLAIQMAEVKAALGDPKGAEEARELARRLVQ